MSRDLILVVISLATWGLGEGMFYFFQPLYLQELGADPQKIGNILGMVGGAMAISYLPAGLLSDRFGRRPLMWAAWIIASLATLLLALANTLPTFVAGMVIYGLTAFVSVPLNAYTTAARGSMSVGRSITIITAAYNLGYISGPLLGGLLASRFGMQIIFRIAMVIFVVSTGVILLIRSQAVTVHSGTASYDRLGFLFKDWRFFRYISLMLLVMLGLYMAQPLTQNFLTNERGVDMMQIGQLLSARSVGIVVLSLVLGQLNARVGLLLSQVSVALFSLLIWLGSGFPAYLAGFFLMGGYNVGRNLAIAQGRSLVDSQDMGAAYGALEMAMALAMVLGPPLAGFLYTHQPEMVYMAAFGLMILGLAANLAFSPVRRKDVHAFEEKERSEWIGS